MKKLVMVEWVDSCSDGGWVFPSTELQPSKVTTVGILVQDGTDYIIVCQSMSSTGNHADRIAIPRISIKRMRMLKVGGAKWHS